MVPLAVLLVVGVPVVLLVVPLEVGTLVALLVGGSSVDLLGLGSLAVRRLVGLSVEGIPLVPRVVELPVVLLGVLPAGESPVVPLAETPVGLLEVLSAGGILVDLLVVGIPVVPVKVPFAVGDLVDPLVSGLLPHLSAAGTHLVLSAVGPQVGFPVGPMTTGTQKVLSVVLLGLLVLYAVWLLSPRFEGFPLVVVVRERWSFGDDPSGWSFG